MSAPPSSAVTLGDGETATADLRVSKLGLSVEALKSEMRRGYVYGVTEQGIDKAAGRTRLAFRHGARSWTVEPDGALVETESSATKAAPAIDDRVSLFDFVATAS